MAQAAWATVAVDGAASASRNAYLSEAMQGPRGVGDARRVVAAIRCRCADITRRVTSSNTEAARHAERIELAHLRLWSFWSAAVRARRRARARVVLVGQVVADVAFWVAGVLATVDRVRADPDLS